MYSGCRVSTMQVPVELVLRMQYRIEHEAQSVKAIEGHVPSLLASVSVQHDLALSGRELERGPIRQFPLVRLYVSKPGGHPEVDVWRARHLAVIGAQRGIDPLEHRDEDVNLLPKLRPLDSVSQDLYLQSCSFVLPWRLAGRACSAGHPSSCRFLAPSCAYDDVGTSLKSKVTEFAHPALLARRLAAFRDHFFRRFSQGPRSRLSSSRGVPPADCTALREPAGIARQAEF
jgi:hypothetical protein